MEQLAVSKQTLPEATLWSIFRGICAGLHVLHRYSVNGRLHPLAHRDLKPANVLLANDGTAVLMDFGSVTEGRIQIRDRRQATALQDDAAEHSSMPFRAPELLEVASDSCIDERVDIWVRPRRRHPARRARLFRGRCTDRPIVPHSRSVQRCTAWRTVYPHSCMW